MPFYSGFKVESKIFGEDAGLNFVEVYPPSWVGVVIGGIIHQQQRNLLAQRQQIFLRCQKGEDGESFALRFDYTFELLVQHGRDFLRPKRLEYFAARMESSVSLAEVMTRFIGEMGEALDWRQNLDFEDGEVLTISLDAESDDAEWVLHVDIGEPAPA
jgi:hypothetical protein